MPKVILIRPFNGCQPGDLVAVGEEQAARLFALGTAKPVTNDAVQEPVKEKPAKKAKAK